MMKVYISLLFFLFSSGSSVPQQKPVSPATKTAEKLATTESVNVSVDTTVYKVKPNSLIQGAALKAKIINLESEQVLDESKAINQAVNERDNHAIDSLRQEISKDSIK